MNNENIKDESEHYVENQLTDALFAVEQALTACEDPEEREDLANILTRLAMLRGRFHE